MNMGAARSLDWLEYRVRRRSQVRILPSIPARFLGPMLAAHQINPHTSHVSTK